MRPLLEGPEEKGVKGKALLLVVTVLLMVFVIAIVYVLFLRPTDPGPDGNGQNKDYEEISIKTEDGWLLRGDLYEPQAGKPTIILIHGMNENRKVWTPLIKDLRPKGYGVLAYDIRAHGQSAVKNGVYTSVLLREDAGNMPLDIKAMMSVLGEHDAASDGVTLVGASIGANAGAVHTLDDARINNMILLSPGDDYQGLQPMDAVKAYKGAVLFVAAYGDDIAYESCKRFEGNATNAVAKDFRYIPFGNYHGTGLFNDESIYADAKTWIDDHS